MAKIELVTSLHAYLPLIYILAPPIAALPNEDLGDRSSSVHYSVLLDAGSSSTKLKVYRWDSSFSGSLVPQIDLITNEKFETGLSDYENDNHGLKLYIEKIVSRAKEDVPSDKFSETPIFLMATAGLRFLSAADASLFLERIRTVMANKTLNPFHYNPSRVTILSGEEEGVYSWIAANYLLGFFDTSRPERESIGILEMGGGSTQIAFIPNDPIFSEEYQVIVAGLPYQLYVQSYLLYGSNSIKMKVAHELAQQNRGNDTLENPCMLRDDKRDVKLEDGRLFTERGTGSPTLCLELLREILKPYTDIRCQPKPCAIGSVYQPSVANKKFVATQAFTYTPKTLKVVENETLHIGKLEEAAFRHCNRSLQQAVNEPGIKEKHASDDCLMGLYIPTLLTTSYGFSRNTTNIRLTSQIGDGKIDWALGAMLVELSNSFGSTSSQITVACKSEMKAGVAFTPVYEPVGSLAAPIFSWISCVIFSISLLIFSYSCL